MAQDIIKDPEQDILSWDKSVRTAIEQGQAKIANKIVDNIKSVFPLQGKRGGNPEWIRTKHWDLRLSYPWGDWENARAYEKRAKTLLDTHKLMNSIQVSSAGQVDPNNYILSIGSDLDYAIVLQNGGIVNAFHPFLGINIRLMLPERPIAFLTKSDQDLYSGSIKEAMNAI